MKRLLTLTSLLAVLLTGCVYPHTTNRTPELRGRVVDAQTGSPLVGAKVHWLSDSTPIAQTDAQGRYVLRATQNWHILVVGHGHWPDPDWLAPRELWFDHPDYRAAGANAYQLMRKPASGVSAELMDVKLEKLIR